MTVEKLLIKYKIPYATAGSNVSTGWIGIQCPFCSDQSYHCGITPERTGFSCWRCGEKGHIQKLLHKLLGKSYFDVRKLLNSENEYRTTFLARKSSITQPRTSSNELKQYIKAQFSQEIADYSREYLWKRGFDADFVWNKYKLYSHSTLVSDFKFRIGIPIIKGRKIINFLGRDTTGQSELRYKNIPNNLCSEQLRTCLFNIDNCKQNKVVVVEGPFDAIRIGDSCCATFGTAFSQEQILRLRQFERVYILYDCNAFIRARQLAECLFMFCKVEILQLDSKYKDPAELTETEAWYLCRQIGL